VTEKTRIVQQVMLPGLQQCGDFNELAEWASALAAYAGMVIGVIHVRQGRHATDDIESAETLRQNVLAGIRTGRSQGL
jgi:hypothetical protein